MRVKSSLGTYLFHEGENQVINEDLRYVIDQKRSYYLFDVVPFAAPRMTQSDRWRVNPNHEDINKRQRKPVTTYYAYKDLLKLQGNLMRFEIQAVLDVLFLIPMPDSWSEKKKAAHNGLPL